MLIAEISISSVGGFSLCLSFFLGKYAEILQVGNLNHHCRMLSTAGYALPFAEIERIAP